MWGYIKKSNLRTGKKATTYRGLSEQWDAMSRDYEKVKHALDTIIAKEIARRQREGSAVTPELIAAIGRDYEISGEVVKESVRRIKSVIKAKRDAKREQGMNMLNREREN